MKSFKMDEMDSKILMDAIFDDLIVVNRNMIVIYATEGFEKNYNIRKELVIGQHVETLEKSGVFSHSVAKEVFRTGERVILSHTNKAGEYFIIHGVPVFGGQKRGDGSREILYAVSYSVPRDEIESLQKENEKLKNLIGEYQTALDNLQSYMSQGMIELQGAREVTETIRKILPYDVSVLFTGESGVGKTTFARYLHDNSTRGSGPFVEISCGAIPENLLESELFGYKKGAFTGADPQGKTGLIETANHGTLFLDEIGELPLALQAKLLKVLQKKTITRVGDVKEIPVDFRLVTATNKDLESMVRDGTFREDLLYRLNVITIHIPALRSRPDDCVTLLKFFVDKFNMKYGLTKRIDSRCMKVLTAYSWPGNIREMSNCIERLLLMNDGDTIKERDLPDHLRRESSQGSVRIGEKEFCFEGTLPEQLKAYEAQVIRMAAENYKTTVMVAKKLGISQPSAARKMKEYLKGSLKAEDSFKNE